MKKQLLALSISLMSATAFAQPTINQADFPTAGDFWFELEDNRTGVHTITPAGPSQSWNYATAFIVDDTTGVNFISPASVPNGWATSFPNSTVAVYSAYDTTAQFFKSLSNGFYADGIYSGSALLPTPMIDVDPDQLLVPGNFTYNSTRNNVSVITFDQTTPPSTIRIKLYNIQLFEGDAYGSLTTPAGTFANTLRIKETSYSVDSTFIDILGTGNFTFLSSNGATDTSIVYSWVKNGTQPLLMSIDYDVVSQQTTGATYTSLVPVGINEPAAEVSPVLVFPNPSANGWVNFRFENADADVLRIYSFDGRLVREERIKGVSNITVSTASFAHGFYLYEAFSESGAQISKGKFAVVK
jgi:hypothetical protein